MRRHWLYLLISLAAIAVAVWSYAATVDFNGEHLVYEFGWQAISAATAEVTVTTQQYAGAPCYRIIIDVRGKPKLDWMWKVRDRLESLSTIQDLHCRLFTFQQRESNYNSDTTIRFDPTRNLLVSTRVRYRSGGPIPMKPFTAPPEQLDPLGALLAMRRTEVAVGHTYVLNVFDGKRSHVLNYDVLAEEHIKTQLGEFDAYKIWPRIVASTVQDAESKVNKVRRVYLWLDKLPPHHVLRIESEVFVGHIYAELIQR